MQEEGKKCLLVESWVTETDPKILVVYVIRDITVTH